MRPNLGSENICLIITRISLPRNPSSTGVESTPVGIRATRKQGGPGPKLITVDTKLGLYRQGNKLGLYRQCAGAGKAGIVANRGRLRIAETACCNATAYGDSIVSLCVKRG